jgi:hypothetical protein
MIALAAFAILQLTPPSADVPYREPQLANSAHLVALAFGAGNRIYVATSADEGRSFSKLVQVAEAGVLPLSRHRGPRVVISRGAIVVTAVAGHSAATGEHAHGMAADGDLLAWRSIDGGKTWSAAVRINDVPAAAREGLHTLAADGRGNLFAAWLDLRKQGTRLYGASSTDSGATWSANVLVYESPDDTICQCCHPSAAFDANGNVQVMWRNWLGGSRDLYLIRSTGVNEFGKPEKLGDGTWKLNACPMDGGGLTNDGGRTITAWRRNGEIYLAEPGRSEVLLGEGKDVAVAASRGQVYALWVKGTELELWHSGKVDVVAPNAAFPSVTALPSGGILAAWEDNGRISVRRFGVDR